MDHEPDAIRQIAQVYVDLISISDGSLAPDELAAALDLASQRAVELGAIGISVEGETVAVDPTNLVAGGMRAMRALARSSRTRRPCPTRTYWPSGASRSTGRSGEPRRRPGPNVRRRWSPVATDRSNSGGTLVPTLLVDLSPSRRSG